MKTPTLMIVAGLAFTYPATSNASPAFACGGAAIAGGAQILCTHIDPKAPAQSCNFSWALKAEDNTTTVVMGTFQIAPRTSNALVYAGFGFDEALSQPIIICQAQIS